MTMTTTLPGFENSDSPGKQGTSNLCLLLSDYSGVIINCATRPIIAMGLHKGTADWEGSCRTLSPYPLLEKQGKETFWVMQQIQFRAPDINRLQTCTRIYR